VHHLPELEPRRKARKIQKHEEDTMLTKEKDEQVLWMAECYSLAKRFPSPHTWLSLLEPADAEESKNFNAFHYWLWMEIWKVAHTEQSQSSDCSK